MGLSKKDFQASTFTKLIDKHKNTKDGDGNPTLYRLLKDPSLFLSKIKRNRLSQNDLSYLFDNISEMYELQYLCWNVPLIKHILKNFLFESETLSRFNKMIENSSWHKKTNIHSVFDLIEYCSMHDEFLFPKTYPFTQELCQLSESNRKVYMLSTFDLNEEQKNEVFELLQNNEIARDRLKYIVDNHLASNYDFDSLMSCLKKVEKKSLLNI